MSRGTWAIESKATGSWVSDGTIYRPNDDIDSNITSTQSKLRGADGSDIFVIPETKYVDVPFDFYWGYIDLTFKTKILNYVKNNTSLRITDHNSETYTGSFINLNPTWIAGTSENRYNLVATFQINNNL